MSFLQQGNKSGFRAPQIEFGIVFQEKSSGSALALILFQTFDGVFAIADTRVDPGLQSGGGVLGLPPLFHQLPQVPPLAFPPDHSDHISESTTYDGTSIPIS